MGIRYEHITIEERCEISRLRSSGQSIRQVAQLSVAPSTIESWQCFTEPRLLAEVCPAGPRRCLAWSEMRGCAVAARLQQGWSPQQVAGRFALISHGASTGLSTANGPDEGLLVASLPAQGQVKRGWRGRKGGSPASFMAHRRPVAERPQEAADRQTAGHWEADLMLFRTYGQAVLILHERHSRLLIALRLAGKAADPIARAMAEVLAPLPPQLRQTVTFDNGTEFARHYQLHTLGIQTFFCDTHSPWQKGGIENAIGRLRRTLPEDRLAGGRPVHSTHTGLQQYSAQMPRLLHRDHRNQVLHLKCESPLRE